MKNINPEQSETVFQKFGVKVKSGDTYAHVFDCIAQSLGLPGSCLSKKRKQWVVGKYLNRCNSSKPLGFEDISLQAMRALQSKRLKEVAVKAAVAERVERKTAERLFTESFMVPVTQAAGQAEHRNVLAWLPSEKFYSSKEWLMLRVEALGLYGRKCCVCGAANVELHVDHVVPRVVRPDLAFDIVNLQILCKPCHQGKHHLQGRAS